MNIPRCNLKNIQLIIVPLALFFALQVEAATKSLANEFLGTNSNVLKNKWSAESSRYNVASVIAAKTWGLDYSSSYADDKSENYFGLNNTTFQSPTKTKVHTIALAKDFQWGGTFSLENSLTNIDAQNATSKINEFSQGVSYTQDLGKNFFGRDFYSDLNIARRNQVLSELTSDSNIDAELLAFFNSINSARLDGALVALQADALARAERRRTIVKRRVRDGLREKVDLIQSEAAVLNQKEQVKLASMRLSGSLEKLSKALHRSVEGSETGDFDLEFIKLSPIPSGSRKGNKQLKILEQKVEVLKDSLEKVGYSALPDVNLSLSHQNNDFAVAQNTAIKDGTLGGDKSVTTVAVNLTWAIGNKPQKAEKAALAIDMRSAEMQSSKIQKNFSYSEESLKNQIRFLDVNITSVKERKALAEKALKEFNRLYNRGRAELDSVIRAEEDLISTNISFVEYLVRRENLLGSLAYLYGSIRPYLLEVHE